MSLLDARKMKARATLGFALFRRVVAGVFFPHGGPKAWLSRLAAEDLASTPGQLWSYVERTSRCIGCGLCDVVAPGEHPGAWFLGEARQPGDAPLARERVQRIRELAEGIAAVCPTRVDPESVARILEDNATALAQARSEA